MHYAQTPRDALEHLSELPYFDRPGGRQLGQWMEMAGAFMEGLANTDQSAGMPGSREENKSVPRQPSALTTVSTAVVTQVSPQISPVMSQQQSSPGATVGANPTQFMPGGLSADQAITPYGSPGMPGYPTNQAGISPYQPYTMDPATGQYVPIDPATGQAITSGFVQPGGGQYSPVSVGGASMTDIPWIPIAIVGGVVGLALLWPKRKRT
ncbi:MAG: hypothetical protein GTN49_10765 [candidate division Zixibacteria bacterium]|nr:hypothetical protein [candidate division Zixibacteria bacterium]